jgi:hypothetical protein
MAVSQYQISHLLYVLLTQKQIRGLPIEPVCALTIRSNNRFDILVRVIITHLKDKNILK